MKKFLDFTGLSLYNDLLQQELGNAFDETITQEDLENITKYGQKEVVEGNGVNDFPETGEAGTIYVDNSTNPPTTYKWENNQYVADSTLIDVSDKQANWGETDSNSNQYIQNKPTIITEQTILDLFGGSSVDPSQNPNVITSNDVVNTTKNGVVPKTTAAVKYLQTNAQGVPSWGDLPTDADTKYKLSVNGTLNGDSTGTDLGSIYAPSTAGTSGQFLKSNGNGAPVWGDKPNYNYGEINYLSNDSTDYTINNSSATLSVDGTQPLQVVTTTANIAGITFSALPADGHSCHLIITAASDKTVDIAHNATMITVESTAYTTVCPKAAAIDTLEITAGGYVELDLLRVGTKIYVRGI